MSNSEYESDNGTMSEEEVEEVQLDIPTTRKKYAPIKDTTAKKQQALKNLEKARLTRKINAENKKNQQQSQYVVDYSDSDSNSDDEIVIKKNKKSMKGKSKGSNLDDEFKKNVLEQLQALQRKAKKKKPDRQTIINLPANNYSSGAKDGTKKMLLDMFN